MLCTGACILFNSLASSTQADGQCDYPRQWPFSSAGLAAAGYVAESSLYSLVGWGLKANTRGNFRDNG